MNERMTYAQWTALTADEQNSIPDEKLPEIPQEQLTNKLTKAICKRVNGEIGWELTQTFSETESSTKWFPAYSLRKVMSQEIWYKLDPTFGTYTMNLTGAEPSLEEQPIGIYGMKWMNFMQEQHPDLVDVMQFHGNYLTVARSVEAAASFSIIADASADSFSSCVSLPSRPLPSLSLSVTSRRLPFAA